MNRIAPLPPRIALRGISKRFGPVIATDGVDLAVQPGEIHALLGENGAGKSTLMKIVYGLLQPDAGEISWEGQKVRIADPHAGRALGIGMVFQHFSLFEPMTVLENVSLGLDRPEKPAALARRIRNVSAGYGLPLDPARAVHTLSVGERQRIEIVRCLLQEPRLLILDEPTSVLTPQEVERLFATLRTLAAEGCSILYISHKLPEIRALCDRATVLRGGRVVATCDPRQESLGSLAQMMIGSPPRPVVRRTVQPGAVRLRVQGLDLPSASTHGTRLGDVSFAVRAGEVLGIAGVAGNGQAELFEALSGERAASRPDAIVIDGTQAGTLDAARRRALGLCAVPEERNGHAAVPEFTLVENAALTAHHRMRLVASGFLRRSRAASFAAQIVAAFGVRAAGIGAQAMSLSGGNLQKFVVGREMLQQPGILVAAQPTWGVDAGAAAAIHAAILDLAAAGSAMVVISQDLDELLAISDRLAVINAGVLIDAGPTAQASAEAIGLLMGGVHGDKATVARPEHALAD